MTGIQFLYISVVRTLPDGPSILVQHVSDEVRTAKLGIRKS